MSSKLLLVALFIVSAQSRYASTDDEQNKVETLRSESGENSIGTYFNGFRYISKVYQECSNSDFSPCMKLKLLSALERIDKKMKEVPLVEGVTFVKEADVKAEESGRSLKKIEATLPRSLDEKEEALNGHILNKLLGFFKTHSLKIKLPTVVELQDSLSEEGRARRRKQGGMMYLLPLMFGGFLIPIVLGALALLAGKALLVSKLALVLATIIGLKKLFSGHGHEETKEIYITAGHGHDSGHSRSYNLKDAQAMAYKGYVAK